MSVKETDKEFLDFIVKSIVTQPDKVEITRTVDEMGVLLNLKVAPEDMGFIIGRRGQTAQAVRTLLKIIGTKNNARVNLKIEEPEGSRRPAPKSEEPKSEEVDTSSVEDLKI